MKSRRSRRWTGSAPLLPMRPGQAERRTHDYKRHGTTSLFAALEVKTGQVLGQIRRRHRAIEFRAFLTTLDAQVPADLEVHVIMDNYGTHKTASIRRWFARHPRFHPHFTPTYASWLNLVERWFAALETKQLRRGVHDSVRSLGDCDSRIHRRVQHGGPTVRVDEDRGRHSREHRPIRITHRHGPRPAEGYVANHWYGTLEAINITVTLVPSRERARRASHANGARRQSGARESV